MSDAVYFMDINASALFAEHRAGLLVSINDEEILLDYDNIRELKDFLNKNFEVVTPEGEKFEDQTEEKSSDPYTINIHSHIMDAEKVAKYMNDQIKRLSTWGNVIK